MGEGGKGKMDEIHVQTKADFTPSRSRKLYYTNCIILF